MKLHIVGSGPAGLAAALAALEAGARVVLIDDNDQPGGQIWRGGPGRWRDARAARTWERLHAHPNFAYLSGARVVGATAPDTLLVERGDAGMLIRWERLVLCTGARERHLPFPGWTLPGVVGAGGLQALIKAGMPVRGREVVVAGSGPLLLAAAASAHAAGARVKAVVEHQPLGRLARFAWTLALHHPGQLRQALALRWVLRKIPYLTGATLVEAQGEARLDGVAIERGGAVRRIGCDFLAAGFGLLPNTDLGRLLGCRLDGERIAVDGAQRTSVPGVWAAGECTGIGGVAKSLAEGRLAALHALGARAPARALAAHRRSLAFAALLARSFPLAPALKDMCTPDTIVCRCEDVRAGRLAQCANGRQAKLLTRVGMGPCQGKVCGAACQFLFGWTPPPANLPLLPATAATLARTQ